MEGWTRSPEAAHWPGNAEALARDLRRAVDCPVRFDRGSRALYATDASNYRQVPIGVVMPKSASDVAAVFEVCRHHGAPILARGGGTSLAGQCCNVAVVLDFSRFMNRVLEVDPERKLAVVEPGCVLDDLRAATAEHGLTFGPDPATHDRCTLGGMIGNNSCGIHSVMAGRTADNVHSLEVLTYDGARFTAGATDDDAYRRIFARGGREAEILSALKQLAGRHGDEVRRRYPDIPRRVSGYNLDELLPENGFHVGRALVGSEGTLVTVLAATVELVPRKGERALVVVSYDDAYAAADHVMEILEHDPIGLEGLDSRLVSDQRKKNMHPDDLALLPQGGGWLLVEFGADEAGGGRRRRPPPARPAARQGRRGLRRGVHRRGPARQDLADPRVRPRRHRPRARPGRHLARLGGLGGGAGAHGRLHARAARADGRARLPRRLLRPLRRRLPAHPHRLRPADPPPASPTTAASSSAPPSW